MIRLDRPVIVEGRYDKSKLASLVDALILTTGGFGIYTDSQRMALFRSLAEKNGVIILTDSDRAGFQIRNYLKSALGEGMRDKIVHIYIPDVYGKESRKAQPSKEGKLGVEGIEAKALIEAFYSAGVVVGEGERAVRAFCKADLYEMGLSGTPQSKSRRQKLLHRLGLPERLSSNGMLEVLAARYQKQELIDLITEMEQPNEDSGR